MSLQRDIQYVEENWDEENDPEGRIVRRLLDAEVVTVYRDTWGAQKISGHVDPGTYLLVPLTEAKDDENLRTYALEELKLSDLTDEEADKFHDAINEDRP